MLHTKLHFTLTNIDHISTDYKVWRSENVYTILYFLILSFPSFDFSLWVFGGLNAGAYGAATFSDHYTDYYKYKPR
jgi:hypothetical protein